VDPDVRFDEGLTIRESLNGSRIVVSTYPQTTILETLSEDFPSILFFRQEHWEFSQLSKPHTESLEEAKVLFFSPEEAAEHVNEVWSSIDQWWEDRENRRRRLNFSKLFSYRPQSITSDLAKLLRAG